MDDYGQFSDFELRRLSRFPNFHHSSPLTFYPQKLIKEIYDHGLVNDFSGVVRELVEEILSLTQHLDIRANLVIDPSALYSYILSQTTTEAYDSSKCGNIRIQQHCLTTVCRDTLFELKSIERCHPGLTGWVDRIANVEGIIADIIPPMATLLSLKSFMVEVRNRVQQRHMAPDSCLQGSITYEVLTVYIIKELIAVRYPADSETLFLVNYDQWLMLTDTVSCRLMTRLACVINDALAIDQIPSWKLISVIYKWGDHMLHDVGVNAYAVIGEFESFVTGAFVTFPGSDPLGLGTEFVEAIMSNALEVEVEYGIPVTWTDQIMGILKGVTSVNCLSEIFGLRKHWGNPMVDAQESGLAVQEKMNEVLPISAYGVVKLLASFNRMITLEFIRQHGRWPECYFLKTDTPYPLLKSWTIKSIKLQEGHPNHSHMHWALMNFLPNVIMNSYEDQLELLSDKSVSLHRGQLDAIYVQALCDEKYRMRSEASRRLMLEFLRTKQESVLDIFKVVMSGATPLSWLANSASMKGTEMKHIKARIFAVLTFELRQYFTATESMIKDEMFKYNPHQTMTMSEHELLKKLRHITRQMDPAGLSRTLSVVHIVDFSKWNLRMKYDNTCLVFKSIDDFLGTPGLIENTHILFSEMINLVQDAFNPPPEGVENTENNTIWRYHIAGWEGQRQKGWTLLTSALLSDLERQTGVKSEICGQGDNQVLLSRFDVPSTFRNPSDWISSDPRGVRSLLDSFYRELEAECTAVGLKVKTAETCRSLCYLNYGKRLYFNGIELSMTLKRISKSVTEPNDTFPTTESILKTEEGASYSAGLYSHPSILPFILSRFSLLISLNESFSNNPLTKDYGVKQVRAKGLQFNGRFLSILSKIPPLLGGPPQLSLASYLYRGHPDPACTDIVMLTLKARSGCEVSRRVLTCMDSNIWYNRSDISLRKSLIMSPYSLNLKLPKSALSPIRDALLPAIEGFCGNPEIKDLFSSNMSSHERDIVKALSSMIPFHPLVANDVFGRTIPGRKHAVLSGLSNTTSLSRLLYENHSKPLIIDVTDLEMRQLDLWILRVIDIASLIKCTPASWKMSHHLLVQRARDKSWGCEIVGVTVPHPLEQFKLVTALHDLCDAECAEVLKEHIVMIRHSEDLVGPPGYDGSQVALQRSRRGNPYLGSTVHEGVSQTTIQCMNPTSCWIDIVRLNLVKSWMAKPQSSLDDFLSSLIYTRTDTPPSMLDLATGKPSRISYSHRAALMSVVRSCAVSSTSNMHSRIYISSNRMGVFSQGDFNYHMPFGPAFLLYQDLLCLKEILSGGSGWERQPRDIYHVHVRTADVPIVFDGKLDLADRSYLHPSMLKIPRLLYCEHETLSFSDCNHVCDISLFKSIEDATITQCKDGYSNHLLGDSLVSEAVLRESSSMGPARCFVTNRTPISIGDIRLVGVGSLVRSISSNIYMLLPFTVIMSQQEGPFKLMVSQFVSEISLGFWDQFSSALNSPETMRRLMRLSAGLTDPKIAVMSTGVISLLRYCVIRQIWTFHKEVLASVIHSKSFPFSLYTPTLRAARYCWSKVVEVIVCLLCTSIGVDRSESIAISRDFSANIHSLDERYFSSVVCIIYCEYEALKVRLSSHGYPMMPNVTIFDSQSPWIEKLKNAQVEEEDGTVCAVEKKLIEIPLNPDGCRLLIPTEILLDSFVECQCQQMICTRVLHDERFFCPSGLLSKSHYDFLGAIMSHELPINSVMCLHSKMGSEAYAIATHNECDKIYVHTTSKITDFSPHLAGSYIPPAFIDKREANKLVCCGKCGTSENDLSTDQGVWSVIEHVRDMKVGGLTVDLCFGKDQSLEEIKNHLVSVLQVVSGLNSVQWVVVRAPFNCSHNCLSTIGQLGRLFKVITLECSLYSPPRFLTFMLICQKRINGRLSDRDMRLSRPVGIDSGNAVDLLFKKINSHHFCEMVYLPSSIRKRYMELSSLADNSVEVACSTYIPGWTSSFGISSNRQYARSCLSAMGHALESTVSDIIRTSVRLVDNEPIMRSSLLSVRDGALYEQVNEIYTVKSRIDLLQSILKHDILILSEVEMLCTTWLSEAHHFTINGARFPLVFNTTKFVGHYSKALYELLGHYYNWEFVVGGEIVGRSIFHRSHPGSVVTSEESPLELAYTGGFSHISDNSWYWQKRAEVMFLFLSLTVLSNQCIYFSSPHDFIIEDVLLICSNLGNRVKHLAGSPRQIEGANALWIGDNDLMDISKYSLREEFLLFCRVEDSRLIHSSYKVVKMYRLPWSGLIPTGIVYHCQPLCSDWSGGFYQPDLQSKIDKAYALGQNLIGCSCVDCSGECSLLAGQDISHYALDKICSFGELESVRDMSH